MYSSKCLGVAAGKILGLSIQRGTLPIFDNLPLGGHYYEGGHYRFLTICPWGDTIMRGDIIQQHGVLGPKKKFMFE